MDRTACRFGLLAVLVTAALLASGTAGQQPLKIDGLPSDVPLELAASATPDRLVLDVRMEEGWHLYASDVGGGAPVSIEVGSGSDFAAAGALIVPPGERGELNGAFRLALPLTRRGSGNRLLARFDFMACDPLMCLPPMSVAVSGEIVAGPARSRVLLVVDEEDDRSRRIIAFLDANGFSTALATYETVTTAICDAHDVVLADSKIFGKTKVPVQKVREFPATRSPIVAVGFLGTELIEAHGLAMTSGYI